ncbi:MAG: hypothetical protein EOO46_11965 [Flavobacterium sp.]|nr:MAG: hypothetical protein EOO46_11965 [Flavobacterium sp.]
MRNYELNNIDEEDFGDFIFKVQDSFDISFSREDFADIRTFGEFSDLIIQKLDGEEDSNCSSQQCFYKIKFAISQNTNIALNSINTNSRVELLFPRENRRGIVRQLEKDLDLNLRILEPKKAITGSIFGLGIYSIILFYYNWRVAILIFMFYCIHN